jgi:hypothetical protein
MKAYKTISIILALAACFVSGVLFTAASNSNTDVNVRVGCNDNGICEPGLGENGLNCSDDCPICNNNGVCEPGWGETAANCAADCPICNNNGICEAERGEDLSDCAADCEICNNNGICEPLRGENYQNCSLDCPPPVSPIPSTNPPSSSTSGQFVSMKPPIIYNLKIDGITLNSANISWETDKQASCQTMFGLGADYEKGTLSETNFGTKHSAAINGLFPGTTYHFKIKCQDLYKNGSETPEQQFSTLSLPDITPPANVSDFQAVPGDKLVSLSWQNPTDADFMGVRIVRSDKFYPADPWAGELIYEGRAKNTVDTGLTNGITYYYTAFSFDASGNYSSGAVARATPNRPGTVAAPPETVYTPAPSEIGKLNLNDFDFIQAGNRVSVPGTEKINADQIKPITISIPYEQVPEVLKTMMVTLQKGGKTFSFLLRVNKEKTKYEATLLPPEPGSYPLTISILDYKNQTFKEITGELNVAKAQLTAMPRTVNCVVVKKTPPILYILLILLALFALEEVCRAIRKRRRSAKIEKQSSKNNF